MFWSKNKKNRYTPAYPSFAIIKVGFKGIYITRTCFRDVLDGNWASLEPATKPAEVDGATGQSGVYKSMPRGHRY